MLRTRRQIYKIIFFKNIAEVFFLHSLVYILQRFYDYLVNRATLFHLLIKQKLGIHIFANTPFSIFN